MPPLRPRPQQNGLPAVNSPFLSWMRFTDSTSRLPATLPIHADLQGYPGQIRFKTHSPQRRLSSMPPYLKCSAPSSRLRPGILPPEHSRSTLPDYRGRGPFIQPLFRNILSSSEQLTGGGAA